MDINTLARGLAYIVLAGAFLAAAVAIDNRQHPTPQTSNADPSPAAGALDAELVHCKKIGTQAADDAICKAAWEANRKRFFGPKKLYQDRVTGAVPATPELKVPASTSGGELPKSAPRLPSERSSTAPHAPGDTAGQSP